MSVCADIHKDTPGRDQYLKDGYYIASHLMPPSLIDSVIKKYQEIVFPFQGEALRKSMVWAKHEFNAYGHLLNPLFLCHIPEQTAELKDFAETITALACFEPLKQKLEAFIDAPPSLVQSMFFDHSPGSKPHQECVFVDSRPSGHLIGAWMALEDLSPDAGLFYLLPLSKMPPLPSFTRDDLHGSNRYTMEMRRIINERKADIVAPQLKKGDVIFWNSRVIHGALPLGDDRYSRKALVCHYVPENMGVGNEFGETYELRFARKYGMNVNATAIPRPL